MGACMSFCRTSSKLADYLDLVAAVEDTCEHLQKPVWLEGYAPPFDPRLRSFSVTPDPACWRSICRPQAIGTSLRRLNAVLFEEARKNRLTAGKFAYDGTHLATGGGSHIVIGGASVADSPLLRRPDLLRSMVAFWQNHPSLSYLFSGMYVGPTSQYPRVDEARMDALYELELAFSPVAEGGMPAVHPRWAVSKSAGGCDGEFASRGVLHRQAVSAGRQGLRLGLLELRAFEMAPHLRMGLMQMLLVRALVCLFWKRPFQGGLVRWGTALHDRFMLPHFVERDFAEVLGELQRAGFAFEEKWFAAQLEFRFPKIGSIKAADAELELRHALEPWNVLAEETTSGGTVRSVDSSLERIQVKLSGVVAEGRYAVACNGRRVPLTPTGTLGESVAGLRYRARMLSSTLHPTIPVHMPLEFEVIDLWSGLSVGRCTYHAGPPDGSIYTSRPSDAIEARERRAARFQVSGEAPVPMTAPMDEVNPVFPMTLDLRRPAPSAETAVNATGTKR